MLFLLADLEAYMLPCLNKKIFGMDCMGCGLQRSISLLLHGEFIAAFKMYPAIYTLIPLIGFVIINILKPATIAYKYLMRLAIVNGIIIVLNFFLKTFIEVSS